MFYDYFVTIFRHVPSNDPTFTLSCTFLFVHANPHHPPLYLTEQTCYYYKPKKKPQFSKLPQPNQNTHNFFSPDPISQTNILHKVIVVLSPTFVNQHQYIRRLNTIQQPTKDSLDISYTSFLPNKSSRNHCRTVSDLRKSASIHSTAKYNTTTNQRLTRYFLHIHQNSCLSENYTYPMSIKYNAR